MDTNLPTTYLVPTKAASPALKSRLLKGEGYTHRAATGVACLAIAAGSGTAIVSTELGLLGLYAQPYHHLAHFGAAPLHGLLASLAVLAVTATSFLPYHHKNRKRSTKLKSLTAAQLAGRIPTLRASAEKAQLPKESIDRLTTSMIDIAINLDGAAQEIERMEAEIASTKNSQNPAAISYRNALAESAKSSKEFVDAQLALVSKVFDQLDALYWAKSAANLRGIALPEPPKALTDLGGLVAELDTLRHTTDAYVQLTDLSVTLSPASTD